MNQPSNNSGLLRRIIAQACTDAIAGVKQAGKYSLDEKIIDIAESNIKHHYIPRSEVAKALGEEQRPRLIAGAYNASKIVQVNSRNQLKAELKKELGLE